MGVNFNVTNKKASTAPGGATSIWQFDSSTTMADPGDKKVRLNNANPSLATQMAISVINANDLDVSVLLSLITSGDVVLMQETQDSSRSEIYTASANPTDNTTWFLIPLTFSDEGTGSVRTGKDVSITFIASSEAAQIQTVLNNFAGNGLKLVRLNFGEIEFEFFTISMDDLSETATNKIMTAAERIKLAALGALDSINLSYTGPNGNGAETQSASYETVACFLFEGSTALATITAIKAIISANGSTSADIRIFDATNSLTIAELTGFTNATPEITNLGSISNVPTGEAIFELQLLRDGGGQDKALCCALQIKF